MATSMIRIKKVCEFCGKEFIAQKASTRYCSKTCNSRAYKYQLRLKKVQCVETEVKAAIETKPLNDIQHKALLTVQEAGVLIGVTTRSVYNLIYARPANEAERNFNRTLLEKAEAIRCLRVTSLINEKFDFLDHDKMRGDFLAYFRKMSSRKYEKWDTVYRHFSNFTSGHCTFGDITIELCKGFSDYLLNAHQLRLTHRKISRNSAAGYFSTFRGLLKTAYCDKLIRENVNDFLDKIETEDMKKNYLTSDELKRLAATPCPIDVLKRASLFSCLTGLRISDVLNLKWEDFEIAPDMGYCIRIRTQKTQTEAVLPVSQEAIDLCGEQSDGTVFKGLTRSMINYPLKKWIAVAGIKKNITFHCFRHTANRIGNGHLYGLEDADSQECNHHPDLRRFGQRQEARNGQ